MPLRADSGRLRPITDPSYRERFAGRPLGIVGTGPSYAMVGREALRGCRLMALNAAITVLWDEPDVWWACHDLWKSSDTLCRIRRWRPWRIVTRRCYLPGKLGDGPWLDVDRNVVRDPFPWRLRDAPPDTEVAWYLDSRELGEAGLIVGETVLEVALDVATLWGASPIVVVGADLAPAGRQSYAADWAWKRCSIRPDKFAAMRRSIATARPRWPSDVLWASPTWREAPFDRIEPAEAGDVLRGNLRPDQARRIST